MSSLLASEMCYVFISQHFDDDDSRSTAGGKSSSNSTGCLVAYVCLQIWEDQTSLLLSVHMLLIGYPSTFSDPADVRGHHSLCGPPPPTTHTNGSHDSSPVTPSFWGCSGALLAVNAKLGCRLFPIAAVKFGSPVAVVNSSVLPQPR